MDVEKPDESQKDRNRKLSYADVLKVGIKKDSPGTNFGDKTMKTKLVKFDLKNALKSKTKVI